MFSWTSTARSVGSNGSGAFLALLFAVLVLGARTTTTSTATSVTSTSTSTASNFTETTMTSETNTATTQTSSTSTVVTETATQTSTTLTTFTTMSSSTTLTSMTNTSTTDTSTTTTTTTTTTTRSTTTTTTSTTTSTTTTTMWLFVEPTTVASCTPMTAMTNVPPDGASITWYCEPETEPICVRFLAAASVAPVLGEVNLSQAEVMAAADETVLAIAGTTNASSIAAGLRTISLKALAYNGSSHFLDEAAGVFTFDPAGMVVLQPMPAPTEYSLLDTYIPLRVDLETCGPVNYLEGLCNPSACSTGLTCRNSPEVCCAPEDWNCCGTGDLKFHNRLYCPSGGNWTTLCHDGTCALSQWNCNDEYRGTAIQGPPCQLRWSWMAPGDDWFELYTSPDASIEAFDVPVSVFPGVGTYLVRAEVPLLAHLSEVTWTVTLTPGEVRIRAPAVSSYGCDLDLTAIRPVRPAGTEGVLNYEWTCSAGDAPSPSDVDVERCNALAANATTDALHINGAELGFGRYRFNVTVRRGQTGLAMDSIIVEVTNGPSASMEDPPELSAQQDFSFSATIHTSTDAACGRPPPWKAWWLMWIGSNASQQLTEAETEVAELVLRPPGPPPGSWAAPGLYKLRLVLAPGPGAAPMEDEAAGVYIFDSAPFEVDTPPANGACTVTPALGNPSTTLFTLTSYNWTDDDLPLQHQFSWRGGTAVDASAGAWATLNVWGLSEVFDKVLFDVLGIVTIRAQAMDALGGVSEAFAQLGITEAAAAPTNEVLLAAVNDVSTGGDDYATLQAVSSAATTGTAVTDSAFATSLLDKVADTVFDTEGALTQSGEQTEAGVAAVANALDSVLTSALAAATATPAPGSAGGQLNADVAIKAADVVATVSNSAATLANGLPVETATTLLGTVATLLDSVSGQQTDTAGVGDTGNAGAGSTGATVEQQRQLSQTLEKAAVALGDAVGNGLDPGGEVTISASGGVELVVKKPNGTAEPFAVGAFNLPSLDAIFGTGSARRLSSGCSAQDITVQNTIWPSNPFAAYNNTPDLQGYNLSIASIEVPAQGVQTLNIRCGGQPQEVHGLSTENEIVFEIMVPRIVDEGADDLRLPVYFDENAQAWSTYGCRILNLTNVSVICSCNHLSAFSALYATLQLDMILNEFLCPNVEVLSGNGIANMGRSGRWAYSSGGILLWVLIVLHVGISLTTMWQQKETIVEDITEDINEFIDVTRSTWVTLDKSIRLISHQHGLWALIMEKTAGIKVEMEDLKESSFGDNIRIILFKLCVEKQKEIGRHGVSPKQMLEPSVEQLLAYFRITHPILVLMMSSMRGRWGIEMIRMQNFAFGSLAVSAMFFSLSAESNSPFCQKGSPWESWQMFLRAIVVGFLSTVIVKVLADGTLTVMMGGENFVRQLFGFTITAIYLVCCIFYIMAFLANVSLADADMWIIASMFRFVSFWFVMPLLKSAIWSAVERELARTREEERRYELKGQEVLGASMMAGQHPLFLNSEAPPQPPAVPGNEVHDVEQAREVSTQEIAPVESNYTVVQAYSLQMRAAAPLANAPRQPRLNNKYRRQQR